MNFSFYKIFFITLLLPILLFSEEPKQNEVEKSNENNKEVQTTVEQTSNDVDEKLKTTT